MQAIGKTDDKMSFPTTWTDILLKSISSSGKSNYTIDVKIGTKRISSDLNRQVTLRQDIPKKRRKQPNPTRISSEDGTSTTGDCNAFDTLSDQGNSKPESDHSSDDSLMQSSSHQRHSPPLNLTKSEIRSQAVSPLPSHTNAVVYHLHHQDVPNSAVSNAMLQLGTNQQQQHSQPLQHHQHHQQYLQNHQRHQQQPHQLHQHQQQQQATLRPINQLKYEPPPVNTAPICLKAQPLQVCGTSKPSNYVQSPTVQIFNPEAYCDQCNKEFCNKYFLKTHKANKHGVYSTDVGQQTPTEYIIDRGWKQPDVNHVMSSAQQPFYASKIAPLMVQQQQQPPPLPPLTNAQGVKNMVNNINVRAFCSICQKEFCNKYFVKRHKAKIHGIYEEGGDYRASDDVVSANVKRTNIKREQSDSLDGCEKGEILSASALVDVLSYAQVTINDPPTDHLIANTVVDDQLIKTEPMAAEQSDGDEMLAAAHQDELTDDPTVNAEYGAGQLADAFPVNLMLDRNALTIEPIRLKDERDLHEEVLPPIGVETNETAALEEMAQLKHKNRFQQAVQGILLKLTPDSPGPVKCDVCNLLVDGSSLKAHFLSKHEEIVQELVNETLMATGHDGLPQLAEHTCPECQQTFVSDAHLRAHVQQCDGHVKGTSAASSPVSKYSTENENEYIKDSRRQSSSSSSTTMLSSFCRICNKELCNKYFMKTHMQRMHGISIQNGNHINGVVCDICNKELCSKYFLRVHKQNSHGIADNAAGPTTGCHKLWSDHLAGTDSGGSAGGPEELTENNHRYYKHYTEVCNLCFRRFRSSKWLSAHLLNDHGEDGRTQWKQLQNHVNGGDGQVGQQSTAFPTTADSEQVSKRYSGDEQQTPQADEGKQYRCSYCSFTTSILSFLFVHEKFHVAVKQQLLTAAAVDDDNDATLACSDCSAGPFRDKAQLETHMIHCHVTKKDLACDPMAPMTNADPEPAAIADRPDVGQDSTVDKSSSMDTNGNDVYADARKPDETNVGHEPFIMQSFFLENCSVSPAVKTVLNGGGGTGRSDSFHSSLVYLPVKEKLTSTVNVFFKLTPT